MLHLVCSTTLHGYVRHCMMTLHDDTTNIEFVVLYEMDCSLHMLFHQPDLCLCAVASCLDDTNLTSVCNMTTQNLCN